MNTPTRRPGTRTDQRRPTKEHRMPPRDYNPKIHADVIAAANALRDNKPELADSLDKIAARGGWALIRPESAQPTLTIRLPTAIKDKIVAQSENLVRDIDEGLTEYLAGRFNPTWPGRTSPSHSATKLNTRPDPELVQQVRDTAEERKDDLGWKPTPTAVALAWLRHKYGL
ncbi:hypothetical protein ACF06T_30515 [Streptomyces albidoflavus]